LAPKASEFGEIMQKMAITPQCRRFWYQSKAHVRLLSH